FDPITLVMRSCTGWSVEDFAREVAYMTEIASPEASKVGYGLGKWWLIPPRGADPRHISQPAAALQGGLRSAKTGLADESGVRAGQASQPAVGVPDGRPSGDWVCTSGRTRFLSGPSREESGARRRDTM